MINSNENYLTRRSFLWLAAAAGSPAFAGAKHSSNDLPPIRAITRGPKFHWFGYYDKLQFDPTSRYVLGMQVGFEHRSPRADDVIKLGMIDLQNGDKWIELGESRAWNWQQGCMLQWLPGSRDEIIWNDCADDHFVSHIFNIKTRKRRTLPAPIYSVSPDGQWAVYPDFRRLNDTRPGYGYVGLPDPNKETLAPKDAGIWRINLKTGEHKLIISFADAAAIPNPHGDFAAAKHWFNHLLFSPDGQRFIFLHRWRGAKEKLGFATRLFTTNINGTDKYVLDPYGKTSHFIWRDPQHIAAWAWHPSHGEKFYLYKDKTDKVEVIAPDVMIVNGHNTYLPGNKWILNDTYPDKERKQNPYLYDLQTGKRHPLGHFTSPPEFTGEWRCDTHPRFSPDGTKVVIDSPHGGTGRQMYLIDISRIVR